MNTSAISSTDKPEDWGLNYPEFRYLQLETILALLHSPRPYSIIDAETGAGKSVYPKALAKRDRVMVLCNTLNLQFQYRDTLQADLLYGRGNYECVHEHSVTGQTASQCFYPEDMNKCPVSAQCEYLRARRRILVADFACLNYAMFNVSRSWIASRPPRFLFLDECHTLPDQVIDWATVVISNRDIANYQLPVPPAMALRDVGQSFTVDEKASLLSWFDQAITKIEERHRLLLAHPESGTLLLADITATKYLVEQLQTVRLMLPDLNEHWFVTSGLAGGTNQMPGLTIKPYTARFHFKSLFDVKCDRVIMMSATVGDFKQFSAELGLRAAETQNIEVDSVWLPAQRPIHVPRLVRPLSSNIDGETAAYLKSQIQKLVGDAPTSWSGLIHTVRKDSAYKILELFKSDRALSSRLFIPKSVDDFNARLRRQPNAIGITHAFHAGVDLPDVNMLFVTKIPFGNLGDIYGAARCRYDNAGYRARAGRELQQMLGRTRRGRAEHYNRPGAPAEKLVVILDGNYSMVKPYMSKTVQDSITQI